jgi:hypothetical protein
MSSQPGNEIIHIIWTVEDVVDMAENLGVDSEVAVARARSWAKAITDNANQGIDEQLCNVVENDSP